MADKVKYKCTSCGYKFERDPEQYARKICPYCSKLTVMTHDAGDAQKFLNDVV